MRSQDRIRTCIVTCLFLTFLVMCVTLQLSVYQSYTLTSQRIRTVSIIPTDARLMQLFRHLTKFLVFPRSHRFTMSTLIEKPCVVRTGLEPVWSVTSKCSWLSAIPMITYSTSYESLHLQLYFFNSHSWMLSASIIPPPDYNKINLPSVTYLRLSYSPIYHSETFVPIFTLLIAYFLFGSSVNLVVRTGLEPVWKSSLERL
jgi:hypothetical protein